MNVKEFILSGDPEKAAETYTVQYRDIAKEIAGKRFRLFFEEVGRTEPKESDSLAFVMKCVDVDYMDEKSRTEPDIGIPDLFDDGYWLHARFLYDFFLIGNVKDELPPLADVKGPDSVSDVSWPYETYAADLSPWTEVLGCQMAAVPDDEEAKANWTAAIYDELSLFGITDPERSRNLQEELEILDSRIKEIEEHPEDLVPIDTAKIREELGFQPQTAEEKDRVRAFYRKVMLANTNLKIRQYNQILRPALIAWKHSGQKR